MDLPDIVFDYDYSKKYNSSGVDVYVCVHVGMDSKQSTSKTTDFV